MKNSIEKLTRQRFQVTFKAGYGYDISGVLIHADRGREGQYVFADVVAYPPEAEPIALEGDIYIDRLDVLILQKLPARVPNADG